MGRIPIRTSCAFFFFCFFFFFFLFLHVKLPTIHIVSITLLYIVCITLHCLHCTHLLPWPLRVIEDNADVVPSQNFRYLGLAALGLGGVYAMFMAKPEKVAKQ